MNPRTTWLLTMLPSMLGSCGGNTSEGSGSASGGTSAASGSGGTSGSGGRQSAGASGSGADVPLCGDCSSRGEVCCYATGRCFNPNSEPDACARPPPAADRRVCASTAQCAPGEHCAADNEQLCLGTGHCVPVGPSSCDSDPRFCQVCGCDGTTYPDPQAAFRAGIRVAGYGGPCGEPSHGRWIPCGSPTQCPGGEQCCAITGRCFPLSDPGQCAYPPPGTSFPCTSNAQCSTGVTFCAGEGCDDPGGCLVVAPSEACNSVPRQPVCGCDKATYESRACAFAAGVRVASNGPCQ